MTRRKRVGLMNERDFPHIVELALPPGPFGSVVLEIDAFHREQRIPVRRGQSRHEAKQSYIRFCFSDAATADGFRNRFGGECLTHAPLKPEQRSYVAIVRQPLAAANDVCELRRKVRRLSAAVATSRAGPHQPRSDRADPHRRWEWALRRAHRELSCRANKGDV